MMECKRAKTEFEDLYDSYKDELLKELYGEESHEDNEILQ
jgi:hypothetical protein